MHKAIRRDARINWICNATHKRRETRGLTSAGKRVSAVNFRAIRSLRGYDYEILITWLSLFYYFHSPAVSAKVTDTTTLPSTLPGKSTIPCLSDDTGRRVPVVTPLAFVLESHAGWVRRFSLSKCVTRCLPAGIVIRDLRDCLLAAMSRSLF